MSRIDRLETQVQATEEDLSEAERHFTWMQPKTPRIDGFDIEVKYRPYGRLGGDFYDFVWLDHDRLGVVVGDVSGHGIQAAILQAMARKLIGLALRQENGDLHHVVEFANRELTNDLPPGSFVAAIIGILDIASNYWSHVRCGIPYPLLVNAERDCQSIVTPGGPLGLSKKADWHIGVGEFATTLEPQQTMLLMSDGIIEIYLDDEKRHQFDVEGVSRAVKETPDGSSILANICAQADLENRADDDATLISITRK
jgi:sigma-B regulation protein RsbU (phosphoserine phosphatase)